MPRIDEIRELLKNMSKEDRLLLIQMCNNENNKEENKDFYNQLSNNHHCPHCHSNKIYYRSLFVFFVENFYLAKHRFK